MKREIRIDTPAADADAFGKAVADVGIGLTLHHETHNVLRLGAAPPRPAPRPPARAQSPATRRRTRALGWLLRRGT